MRGKIPLAAAIGALIACGAARAFAQEEAQDRPTPEELAAWLDARFGELWAREGIKPAPKVDDATFLRRVSLDLVGTIPSVARTRDFLEDSAPYKRAEVVEAIIEGRDGKYTDRWTSQRSAEHLARVWRRILVPPGSPNAGMGVRLDPWLKQQFEQNVSYDRFARNLLTATPASANAGAAVTANNAGPAAFFQAVGTAPDTLADNYSRIFLGVRIGCAKCHDHPFADWSQEDFWGMAAFFAETPGQITAMDSGLQYTARFLGDDEDADLAEDANPREALADWVVAPENPNFAATAVNRIWQHLHGRPLVGSVEDLDLVSEQERSLVLDDLAAKFAEGGFDLRWLMEGICKSTVYQRRSRPASAAEQPRLAAYRPLKALTPEQVFDALEEALSLSVSNNERSPRHNGQRAQLVARLSETVSNSPEKFRAGIPQTLMLMNGELISTATDLNDSRTLRAVVDAPFLKPEEKIETLFLATYTRKPRAKEQERLLKYVNSRPTEQKRRRAYAEVFWALLNSPEFVLCR